MHQILELADRAYWWLAHHRLVAAGLVAATVALFVLGFRATGGDDGGIPAGAVAIVGDTPITQAELSRWQAIYSKAAAGQAQKPTAAEARTQAFELLAGSAWIAAEADARGVEVTDAQVQESIDGYFQQTGATGPEARKQVLGQLGVEEEQLRYQQRVSLLSAGLREKVAEAVKPPSAAAVSKLYEEEPERWAKPSRRDVRVVIARDEATANRALEALRGGASFEDALKEFSNDPTLTEQKGVLNDLEPGSNVVAFEKPVFTAPLGELQGPVKVDGGFMVFAVQDIEALPERTLEQATEAITTNLTAIARTTATDRYLRELRDRWKARTTCAPLVQNKEFCRVD